MIEVIINKQELKGLQMPSEYIRNKLISSGIPLHKMFAINNISDGAKLTREVLGNGEAVLFKWEE